MPQNKPFQTISAYLTPYPVYVFIAPVNYPETRALRTYRAPALNAKVTLNIFRVCKALTDVIMASNSFLREVPAGLPPWHYIKI